MREHYKSQREKVQEEYPYNGLQEFLDWKAAHGDTEAAQLCILAQKKSEEIKNAEQSSSEAVAYAMTDTKLLATLLQDSTKRLSSEFQDEKTVLKARLEVIREEEAPEIAAVRRKWEAERKKHALTFMSRQSRYKIEQAMRDREKAELQAVRQAFTSKSDEIKKESPYSNWAEFLQWKAEQGNAVAETALAVLRSKKEDVTPSTTPDPGAPDAACTPNTSDAAPDPGVLGVSSVPTVPEAIRQIDKAGVVIFSLPSGGTVRDNGKMVYCSPHDKAAQTTALKYAQEKWGKQVTLDENRITVEEGQAILQEGKAKSQPLGRNKKHQPSKGMGR